MVGKYEYDAGASVVSVASSASRASYCELVQRRERRERRATLEYKKILFERRERSVPSNPPIRLPKPLTSQMVYDWNGLLLERF